jgi:uncharacterized protein YecT (DUF1311 family)
MKHMSKIFISFLFFILPLNARAESKYWASGASAIYDKCRDAIGGQTFEMLKCDNEELKLQDLELNKVYKELEASIQQKEREELEKSQRDWVVYRASTCQLMSLPERGGSLAYVINSACNLSEIIKRIKVLKELKQ